MAVFLAIAITAFSLPMAYAGPVTNAQVCCVSGDVNVISPDGNSHALTSGDSIGLGDQIVTGPNASIQMTLSDGESTIFVGQSSSVTMDADTLTPPPPQTPTQNLIFRIRGIFRVIMGPLIPAPVRFVTYTGSGGIRGTTVEIDTEASGVDERWVLREGGPFEVARHNAFTDLPDALFNDPGDKRLETFNVQAASDAARDLNMTLLDYLRGTNAVITLTERDTGVLFIGDTTIGPAWLPASTGGGGTCNCVPEPSSIVLIAAAILARMGGRTRQSKRGELASPRDHG
ncbi:MAG: PEP-CTERM sorting domain-containing protein [Burkholderiales bacterium]